MSSEIMLIRMAWISIILILFSYLLLLQTEAAWPFTIDDMYITLRYAKHWAQGYGIVWNVGELPVEGYSNFIFLLFARWCYALHINPVIGLKVIGSVSLFFSSFLLFSLSRWTIFKRSDQWHFAFIPPVWLLAYRGEILWSVSGLETAFYALIMIAAVYCLIRLNDSKHAKHTLFIYLAGVFLTLMCLTRPEGIVLMVVFLFLFLKLNKYHFSYFFRLFLPIFLVVLPYYIWRLYYFGYWFPNPVYCKGNSNFVGQLDLAYLKLIWPFVLMALPCLCLFKEKKAFIFFLSLPSLIYLICCLRADPIVAFDNRLFLPAFALWLPLTLLGLTTYFQRNWQIYISALLLFFWIPKLSLTDYQHFAINPIQGEQLRMAVASWISSYTQPHQSIVLADCGLIPYLHSKHRFIDSYCLNNLSMAHRKTDNRYIDFCDQVLKDQPEVFILTAWNHQHKTIYTPVDACLAPLLKDHPQYEQVATYRTTLPGDYYQYVVYKKRIS